MFTSEDIRSVLFTKTMGGGYKSIEVDDFIDRCADTVDTLAREKEEMAKKMEILADKLVEYRNEEDNIRTALLTAQRAGDTLLREANHKVELIMEDARIKAENLQESAQRQIKNEEQELTRIKEEVTGFKVELLSLSRKHLALINLLPETEAEPSPQEEDVLPPDEQPESAEQTVSQPEGEPEQADNEPETAPEQPALQEEGDSVAVILERFSADLPEPEDGNAQSASRFEDLQFGDSYDVKGERKGRFGKKK